MSDDQPIETLPLDAWHRARGARMVPFAGYEMPIQYKGIIAEHLWTRAHAGLFDVSHMGQLDVSGEGAATALETLLPGDIVGLAPGRLRYSLFLNDEGGVLDDLMVTNLGSSFHLVVNGAMKWDDIAHLREHLPDEITLHYHDEAALLALQGPDAAAALEPIIPGVCALGFMQFAAFEWKGEPIGVSRSGYTGEDGFEISVPASHVEALADALCAQPEVRPVGLGARDLLRLEAGLPLYGHDLDRAHNPVEANLAFAISRSRRANRGFPAAGVILDQLANGTSIRRIGMLIAGRQPAREGAEIFAGAERVGIVTSGGFSPSLQTPIAMGYVNAAQSATGTALEIDVRGKRIATTVTPMPFVPHRYHRKGVS